MKLVSILLLFAFVNSYKLRSTRRLSPFPSSSAILSRSQSVSLSAVMPGDPIITGTLAQGLSNAVEIFSNVILARFALSWFPQLPRQFPILRPVFTVTEPYLAIFRSQIPPIAGFDISAIPALFCLNILSQTCVAVGAEFPPSSF